MWRHLMYALIPAWSIQMYKCQLRKSRFMAEYQSRYLSNSICTVLSRRALDFKLNPPRSCGITEAGRKSQATLRWMKLLQSLLLSSPLSSPLTHLVLTRPITEHQETERTIKRTGKKKKTREIDALLSNVCTFDVRKHNLQMTERNFPRSAI